MNRKEYVKEYYLKNKEHLKKRANEYYLKNKEHLKKRANEYNLKNKERIRELNEGVYGQKEQEELNASYKQSLANKKERELNEMEWTQNEHRKHKK